MKILLPRQDALERNAIANKLLAAIQHYGDDLDLLLHLRWLGFRPNVVYDIGASNGIWSSVAGLVFPEARFELFEPLSWGCGRFGAQYLGPHWPLMIF